VKEALDAIVHHYPLCFLDLMSEIGLASQISSACELSDVHDDSLVHLMEKRCLAPKKDCG
jgi:hypothetical protein